MGVIARAGSPGDQQTHQFRPWAALSGERMGPWWVNIRPYPSSKRLHLDFKSNNIGIFTGNRGDCPFVALRSTDMTVGDSKAGFPVDDFFKISTLAGYGTKPKLTLYSRMRKLSSKNAGIFRYNPLSIKAAIPYTLLACQNHRHSGVAYGRYKKSVATASRSRWRHSMRQT